MQMHCAKKVTFHPLRTIHRSCLLFITLAHNPLQSSLRVKDPTFLVRQRTCTCFACLFRGGRFGRDTTTNSSARGRVDLHSFTFVLTARLGLPHSILSSVRWWALPRRCTMQLHTAPSTYLHSSWAQNRPLHFTTVFSSHPRPHTVVTLLSILRGTCT